jgi:hypothetical protein
VSLVARCIIEADGRAAQNGGRTREFETKIKTRCRLLASRFTNLYDWRALRVTVHSSRSKIALFSAHVRVPLYPDDNITLLRCTLICMS